VSAQTSFFNDLYHCLSLLTQTKVIVFLHAKRQTAKKK
jgi:hypothetical protein